MTTWTGATCRSCGEPILWTITEAGKRMPVDRDPTTNGNLEVTGAGRELASKVVGQGEGLRYKSHFATCVHANEHRR